MIWVTSFFAWVLFAWSCTPRKAGNKSAIRMPSTVITTRSSISVNPSADFDEMRLFWEIVVTAISASVQGTDIASSRSGLASKSHRRFGANPGAAQAYEEIAIGADHYQTGGGPRSRFADSSGARATRCNRSSPIGYEVLARAK